MKCFVYFLLGQKHVSLKKKANSIYVHTEQIYFAMAVWDTEWVFNLSPQHICFHKINTDIKLKPLEIKVIIRLAMFCIQHLMNTA